MPESRGAGRPGMFQVRRGHGTARETEQDAVRWAAPSQTGV